MEKNFAENLIINIKDGRAKKSNDSEDNGTKFTIENESLHATLNLQLKPHKSILVDASVFMAMDPSITLMTKLRGGLVQNLTNSLGKEVLLLNQFGAEKQAGSIHLSPALPGTLHHYSLSAKTGIYLQSSHFMACEPTVQINTTFAGMKDFYNDPGTFLLHCIGQGNLWFNAYGGVLELPLDDDLRLNPDYILAFEDTITYTIESVEGLCADNLKGGFFGGNGRLCRFQGEGRVWMQTRQTHGLLNYIWSSDSNLFTH